MNPGLNVSIPLSHLSTSPTGVAHDPDVWEDLPCSAYVNHVVDLLTSYLHSPNTGKQRSKESESAMLATQHFLNNVASPAVCMFGIVGNLLNLIVLTRKQLQRSMDRMERSVSVGLVALAASDLIFCVFYMTGSLVKGKMIYSPLDNRLALYFKIYQEGLINVFMLTSTWLTVNMALGRYVAICHPLHARGFINLRATRVAVVCIFFASVILNLPRFWHYYAQATPCSGLLSSLNSLTSTIQGFPIQRLNHSCECTYYSKTATKVYTENATWFVFAHGLVYSILGVFLPLIVLTVCNVCLVRALRRSYRMQSLYRANKPSDSGHRITPTLIAIILLFTFLVTPADLVNFARLTTDHNTYPAQMAATDITNFLLTINFSVNFVLYCVVSAQFRRTTRNLLLCRWYGTGGRALCGTSQGGTGGGMYEGREITGRGGTQSYVCNFSETELMPTISIYQQAMLRDSDDLS